MKASLYKSTITFFMVFVVVYALTIVVAQAEEATADVSATIETQASPTPTKTIPPSQKPPIRAVIKNNIEQNKEMRNNLLEKKQEVRKDLKADIKDIRTEAKGDIKDMRADMRMKNSSTTAEMFKRNTEIRKDIAKKMEARIFEARKNALVKELVRSLENLSDISTRIDSRITKVEAEGRTMTEAHALLVTANEKLAKAKVDVAAFEALPVPTPSAGTDVSPTAEVDLVKPRTVGDTAIKSVKEARDAFQKVVRVIATVSPSPAATN